MRTCVIVFAREPVLGRVKRRLAADIGEERALRVYQGLLHHALEAASSTGLDVTLALAGEGRSGWEPPAGIATVPQEGPDLGTRMRGALTERFAAGYEGAVLFGTDIPSCGPAQLVAAARMLERHPVVLGPALDGGYYLVAQRAPIVDIFVDVPWSSPHTMVATRGRLAQLGVNHEELGELADVDTIGDLRSAVADPGLTEPLRARLRAALGRERR